MEISHMINTPPSLNTLGTLQASRETILNNVLRGMTIAGAGLILLSVSVTVSSNSFVNWVILFAVIGVIGLIGLMAYHTEWPYNTRTAVLLGLLYLIGLQDAILVGLVGDARITFLLFSVLGILLLNRRMAYVLIFLALGTVFVAAAFSNDLPKTTATIELYTTGAGWLISSLYIGLTGFVSITAVGKVLRDTQNALDNETVLLQNLADAKAQSEQRIASRIRALNTSNEISNAISNLLPPDELIRTVLEQIRAGFGYYHVQLYRLDPAGGYLYLMGSTGEHGSALLANKHKVAIGRGLVGYTAFNNEYTLVPDVQTSERWLPNPLLPDTQAELTIPLRSDNKIQGVLDVQHNIAHGLTLDDVYVLQVIADQLAVALQNAGQYAQIQQRIQREVLLNELQNKIQSANTPQQVLAAAAQTLSHNFGGTRVDLIVGELADK